MSPFDTAAVLVALAAAFGFVNYRWLHLPATIGVMGLALASALAVLLVDAMAPGWHLRASFFGWSAGIDFNALLMHGMLGLLLFAGALHVGFQDLFANRWEIGTLATLGVAISTALVGLAGYVLFRGLGLSVPLPVCLAFGALISPTDPVAVLGLMKRVRASPALRATIAGESLFNDGVGVVAFLALGSWAGLVRGGSFGAGHVPLPALAWLLVRQIGGGVCLGLAASYAAYRALKTIDHRDLELLITLALALAVYAVSFPLGVSGPIAVVVAGLFIGNHGRQFAMSRTTIEHVDAFWGMIDEILNAVLFLLIGLTVFSAHLERTTALAAAAMVPIALAARWISVAAPLLALRRTGRYPRGVVTLLTWGGLRGGLSVAMALSLQRLPSHDLLLGCTYGVVVFSVLVQGLTMNRLLKRFEPAGGSGAPVTVP
jgi:CPA1 family monovalent cation:H+ antiporter